MRLTFEVESGEVDKAVEDILGCGNGFLLWDAVSAKAVHLPIAKVQACLTGSPGANMTPEESAWLKNPEYLSEDAQYERWLTSFLPYLRADPITRANAHADLAAVRQRLIPKGLPHRGGGSMKFRQHRRLLDESMETVVELADHAALMEHIRGIARHWPSFPPVTDETVHIEPFGRDERIGWDAHVVRLDGYGVLGFTDGPAQT
jgi:hypothetical protein